MSLLWLRAGEAAVIAASMPVWVSLLALLILNEHFSLLRALALAIALAGLAILFGADGFEASVDKLPGALLAITATLLRRARHRADQAVSVRPAGDLARVLADRDRLRADPAGGPVVRAGELRRAVDDRAGC